MNRPATLVRANSESAPTATQRPIHMFLRTPTYSEPKGLQRCRSNIERSPTSEVVPTLPQLIFSHDDSSSEDSIFDDHDQPASLTPFSDVMSDAGYFTDMSEMEEAISALDLSCSGFDTVPVSLFAESDCFLRIHSLDLSDNPFATSNELYLTETIFLPQLTSLFLRSCGMSRVEPLVTFMRAPNLKELDISNHQFDGNVPEFQKFFPKLETLLATSGLFDSLDEAAVMGLRLLDLSDNRVKDEDGRLVERCHELGTKLLL